MHKALPRVLLPILVAVTACGQQEPAETEEAANPCATANPCAATQPDLDPARVTQGDRMLNAGGLDDAALIARGGELWNDNSLSTNGSACSTCHVGNYALIKATFAEPYPHPVAMAKNRAGLDQVNAAEMVQLCMIVPMATEPLAWDSQELAALAAYVEHIRPGFDPTAAAGGANPCNPCGGNPCNPCGGNPCNPCASNPCKG
jgi:cytochrome c